MAALEQQAKSYIRDMQSADRAAREKYSIDAKDVTLAIRVDVQTSIKYHNHEDED